jgi:hypothetical protein
VPEGEEMIWIWIVLGVFGIAAIFLFALLSVGARGDRKARHIQHSIDPFTDVTITREGE